MPEAKRVERIFEEWFKGLPHDLAESLGPLLADYKKGAITIHELLVGLPTSIIAQVFNPVIDSLKMLEDRVSALETADHRMP